MSHEIRTPLNGILGNLELLKLTDVDPHAADGAQARLEAEPPDLRRRIRGVAAQAVAPRPAAPRHRRRGRPVRPDPGRGFLGQGPARAFGQPGRQGRQPAHPGDRRYPDEPDGGPPPAPPARPRLRPCGQRRRRVRACPRQHLFADPDRLPHAGDGRLRVHPRAARLGGRSGGGEPADPRGRHDRQRASRRRRASRAPWSAVCWDISAPRASIGRRTGPTRCGCWRAAGWSSTRSSPT
nr:histidine kinase dimerization/phospho-acceptor domain-containing protein [Skermanella pratensis]